MRERLAVFYEPFQRMTYHMPRSGNKQLFLRGRRLRDTVLAIERTVRADGELAEHIGAGKAPDGNFHLLAQILAAEVIGQHSSGEIDALFRGQEARMRAKPNDSRLLPHTLVVKEVVYGKGIASLAESAKQPENPLPDWWSTAVKRLREAELTLEGASGAPPRTIKRMLRKALSYRVGDEPRPPFADAVKIRLRDDPTPGITRERWLRARWVMLQAELLDRRRP